MPLPAAPRPICPTVLWRRLTSERRVALMRAASVTTAVPCWRSEEHTSELQSQSNLVCRLLLEKKKPDLFLHSGLSIIRRAASDVGVLAVAPGLILHAHEHVPGAMQVHVPGHHNEFTEIVVETV